MKMRIMITSIYIMTNAYAYQQELDKALCCATHMSAVDRVEQLLAEGANPDADSMTLEALPKGMRPLHVAVSNANILLVNKLIDYGVDPFRRDVSYCSALELAQKKLYEFKDACSCGKSIDRKSKAHCKEIVRLLNCVAKAAPYNLN